MGQIRIEPANADHAADCAFVLRTSRQHGLPYLPDLHTPDEDVRVLAERVFPANWVVVAFDEAGTIVGSIAFGGGWVNHLYVLPESQRQGIGSRLLDEAKQQCVSRKLRTFEQNHGARRFYERHGFSLVKRTDGSENEEKEPDVLLQWHRQTS